MGVSHATHPHSLYHNLFPLLAPAKAGAHPILPPLPSWERIKVRVIGVMVGLTGKLCKGLLDGGALPHAS